MAPETLLVDIVLPIYRPQQCWIREAVDCVLAQTYPHWHLTVVDDASPDDSLADLQQAYSDYHDSVSTLQLKENRRAAGARMEAIARGQGDVIAFIDQDDRWHPRKLEYQVGRLLQEPVVEAVHTDVRHIDEHGATIRGGAARENALRASIPYDLLPRDRLMEALFLKNSIRLVSAVVLRQAFEQVGGFDGSLFGGEDWDFWLRLVASGYRIAHVPQLLVERRIHSGNVSSTHYQARTESLLQACDKTVEMYPSLEPLASRRQARILRSSVLRYLKKGNGRQIRPQIRQIIRLAPSDHRGYLLWILSHLGPLQSRLTTACLSHKMGA
jgi:glycosyltransferase involved in cell wall biosynthesis